jgi:hypothetical protein
MKSFKQFLEEGYKKRFKAAIKAVASSVKKQRKRGNVSVNYGTGDEAPPSAERDAAIAQTMQDNRNYVRELKKQQKKDKA